MKTPSPYFRIVVLALGLLVLAVIGILNNAAYGATPEKARAPVVQPSDSGVMRQTGWFTYDSKPDAIVLYCVPEGESTLTCVVFVATPKGNAVVLVDGIPASEVAS